ncbi:hypothetical protein Tco_1167851 [Tanacetum coccineum]
MLDSYTAYMCMQSWGSSSYARVMIEIRDDVELKDNIVVTMLRIKGEGYYTCNIRVEYEWKPLMCACCKKIGFKPKQVFQPVSKKSTANTCGKKKNNSESTKKVSKSNPFEVLTSVDNDVELGKLRFVDDDGNPLVPTGIVDSASEVEVVFNETANLRLSKNGKDGSDKGYDTNSLLEQWRDSYLDNDDCDPYDDNMYENHDILSVERMKAFGYGVLSLLVMDVFVKLGHRYTASF